MTTPIKLHWSRSKPNFGDALSPLLCEHLSARPIKYAKANQADLIGAGSLLQRLKEGFWRKRIHVWGTGFIEHTSPYHSRHYFHAVRGELTRDILGLGPETPIGDPGLLANRLIPANAASDKRHRIGIIPHYKDTNLPLVKKLVEENKHAIELNIFEEPRLLIKQIAACDFIFSSAMHGLIVADSLGVPNAWIRLSNSVRGGGFKFRDYYSIFSIYDAMPARPEGAALDKLMQHYADHYQRPGLCGIQNNLEQCFPTDI